MGVVDGATVERVAEGYLVRIPAGEHPGVEVATAADALREMLARSGESGRAVSAAIGRSAGYVGGAVSRGSDIGAANLARMARAAGYEMVLRGHGGEIRLVPTD